MLTLSLTLSLASLFSSAASPPLINLQQEMVADLSSVDQVLRLMYAPTQWKRDYFGWDRQEQLQQLEQHLYAHPALSITQFRQKLRAFVQSTRDYHTNISFFSTESAHLPFEVAVAEGRVFIYQVDKESEIPLHIGDELLEFEGQSAYRAITNLMPLVTPMASEQTDLALAALVLTQRKGASAHPVPQGIAQLKVRSSRSGKVMLLDVPWKYQQEKIAPIDELGSYKKGLAADKPVSSIRQLLMRYPLLRKQSLLPLYEELKATATTKEYGASPRGRLGAKNSFIPELGPILWRPKESKYLQAYIYKMANGQQVGYVRIPDYVSGAIFEGDEKGAREELAELIQVFNAKTDALVIDQVDNAGGYLFHLLDLTSMLISKPLKMFPEHFVLTPEEIANALELLDALEEIKEFAWVLQGDVMLLDNLKTYCQFILDQWQKGFTITEPFYLFGIEEIPPNSLHYTKPILLVINELDFSCADLLPALLQDNQQATLFGVKTAGAGGSVSAVRFPNRSGIARMSYTSSLLLRHNGQPLENLGVQPDVTYQLTKEDLQNNYKSYVIALNKEVAQLLRRR